MKSYYPRNFKNIPTINGISQSGNTGGIKIRARLMSGLVVISRGLLQDLKGKDLRETEGFLYIL